MIRSSYQNNLDYSDIFAILCFMKTPELVVEIGILDGYSLESIHKNVSKQCNIDAYDIFDEFNGNSADKNKLIEKFKEHDNISIKYGDLYEKYKDFKDNTIDILHVDIANNGDTYEFVLCNYLSKIRKDGIIILEGGSEERDNIEWMNNYTKPKICPVLRKYDDMYDIVTIGNIPSITIVKRKL